MTEVTAERSFVNQGGGSGDAFEVENVASLKEKVCNQYIVELTKLITFTIFMKVHKLERELSSLKSVSETAASSGTSEISEANAAEITLLRAQLEDAVQTKKLR